MGKLKAWGLGNYACVIGGTMSIKFRVIALGALGTAVHLLPHAAMAQIQLQGIVIEGVQNEAGAGDVDPSTAIDGYVAESSNTGTKTGTPLNEIPQSISVVTRDQLEDRGADTLEDAIGYSAGVAINPYGVDSRYDQFIIRGFEQNTTGVYRDGLRLPAFSFTAFRIEPYGVDHIDIMRGPTSTLYGLNNPGGLVNVISKMPTEKEFGEVWASYGTHNDKAVGFDVGGPVADGKVLYRVTGQVRDADTQVDYVENDRIYIAPALTFRPSATTTFTILANYQKDKTGDTFQLLPAEGVLDGSISRGTFLGDPDWSHLKGEQWSVGYKLEHELTPAWTFRQNLRYDHAKTDYQTIYPQAGALDAPIYVAPTSPDELILAGLDVDESLGIFQVDNQLQFKNQFGRFENTLLVGMDYNYFNGQSTQGYGVVVNRFQNPYAPSYGPSVFVDPLNPTSLSATPPIVIDQELTQETVGLYLQDQIKFDKRWAATIGIRHDWVSSELDDALPLVRDDTSGESEDKALTRRIGLNYLFDNGLTPYASYSTSFFPVPLTGTSGTALNPEEGEQYEAGIKYQPKGYKSYGLVSVFDLTKQNVTQQKVSGVFVQLGEVQVRGLEIEGTVDFDNGWKALGAYSYWDAEITEDSNKDNVGKRPVRIPEHIATMWLDYTFQAGMLKGLGLGAGVRYIGSRFGDNANNFEVSPYTLFDAGIRYELDDWNVSLNMNNIFDEDYASTCSSVTLTGEDPYNYCSYGEGRTATFRVGYKW